MSRTTALVLLELSVEEPLVRIAGSCPEADRRLEELLADPDRRRDFGDALARELVRRRESE